MDALNTCCLCLDLYRLFCIYQYCRLSSQLMLWLFSNSFFHLCSLIFSIASLCLTILLLLSMIWIRSLNVFHKWRILDMITEMLFLDWKDFHWYLFCILLEFSYLCLRDSVELAFLGNINSLIKCILFW